MAPAKSQAGKTSCESFFVYEMCMTDTTRDGSVDYAWFADDDQIFMFRPGAELPADKPMHRCAKPMRHEVMEAGSRLLYGDDLNLLEEMDVKRKLLVNYMAAKNDVDDCYGGNSRIGVAGSAGTGAAESQAESQAESEFGSEDFDWGEE